MENLTDLARFAPHCKLFVLVIGHFLLDSEITRSPSESRGHQDGDRARPRNGARTGPLHLEEAGQTNARLPANPFSSSFTAIPLQPFSSPSRRFSGWVGALLASALTINLYSS